VTSEERILMMRSSRPWTLLLIALAVLAMGAAAALAAKPKDGTYAGKTDSGAKITIKVSGGGEKATVSYCDYKMPSPIKNGKFEAKHAGPGGVYVGLEGSFPTRKTAKGKITTDYLCNTQGESFTAKLK
jgi:hypothetical protein